MSLDASSPEAVDLVAAVERLLRRAPGLVRLLVAGSIFLFLAMGMQVVWPGVRTTRLEAKDVVQDAAYVTVNVRVDSVADVLKGHLADEAVTRRATQIWLCLNSRPDDQDMLQLPCTNLIQNAIRSRQRRGAYR
jgi:hypothetical protein